jgi:hypothetical protein
MKKPKVDVNRIKKEKILFYIHKVHGFRNILLHSIILCSLLI